MDVSEEVLQKYERANREIKRHWIWRLCGIAPGDFATLSHRCGDRFRGMKLNIAGLKEQARRELEQKNKQKSVRTIPRFAPTEQVLELAQYRMKV